MSEFSKIKKNGLSALEVLGKIVSDKKEVKTRVKNGENFISVAKEKGLKIVFPL